MSVVNKIDFVSVLGSAFNFEHGTETDNRPSSGSQVMEVEENSNFVTGEALSFTESITVDESFCHGAVRLSERQGGRIARA